MKHLHDGKKFIFEVISDLENSKVDSVLLLVRFWDVVTESLSNIKEITIPQNETCGNLAKWMSENFEVGEDDIEGTKLLGSRQMNYKK